MKLVFLTDSQDARFLLNTDCVRSYLKLGFTPMILKENHLNSNHKKMLLESGVLLWDTSLESLVKSGCLFLKLSVTSEDLNQLPENSQVIGLFDPFNQNEIFNIAKTKHLTLFSLDLIPRSTIAQSMDVLSSQANLSGYQAIIQAANYSHKLIPLMMTPAGNIPPCRVLVLGAGVAGLQAIATAKRLGAIVEAFDTRPAAKENIESLGAKAINLNNISSQENQDGYAKQLNETQQKQQQDALIEYLKKSDIIITTAQVFGKKAPRLITKDMLKHINKRCVIVDLAAQSGGNVEGSKQNQILELDQITLIGQSHLAQQIPQSASDVLAKNSLALIKEIISINPEKNDNDACFSFNTTSDIYNSILLTKSGQIKHPSFLEQTKGKKESYAK